jgi:threonine dehydratase
MKITHLNLEELVQLFSNVYIFNCYFFSTLSALKVFSMADPAHSQPLTRTSVIAAHSLIKQYIHYTPVLTNTTLTQLASTPQTPEALEGTPWAGEKPANPKIRLWFKCENLQKVGAFKVRGAFHALTRLMAEDGWAESGGKERGVVTHSSGMPLQCFTIH